MGINGAMKAIYLAESASDNRTFPISPDRHIIIAATPIEYISTVFNTREIIRSIRALSSAADDSEISGTRSPAKDDDIADGNKIKGNTTLCTVPYAARDISRVAPLFSSPNGIRICSTVTSAERIYALSATGTVMPSSFVDI